MSTSAQNDFKVQRAYVPTSALARLVEFDAEFMHVTLTDGRVISAPLLWFPLLQQATSEQRAHYEIGAGGRGLHWPEIDEDLSVSGLLSGADQKAA